LEVSFSALIKQISIKSLVSGDKEAQLILRFIPTDEILDGLNRLHRADEEVYVGIVSSAKYSQNQELNNAIQVSERSIGKSKGKAKGNDL
jgi:hypothetical protein